MFFLQSCFQAFKDCASVIRHNFHQCSKNYRNNLHFWLVLQLQIDHVTTYLGARAELQANLSNEINFLSAYCHIHETQVPQELINEGFYLGFIVWGRSPEWRKATGFLGGSGGMLPLKCFEMNMRCDAIWCILRPNFEKCALTSSRLDDFSDIVTYML